MDDRTIGLYLSRILSGYYIFLYNGQKFKLLYPDIQLKYEAEIYAQEEYDKNKYNDWIKEEEVLYILDELDVCSLNTDNHLKSLEEKLDNLKVDLYKNFLNPSKSKTIAKAIDSVKKQYNKLYNLKHSLDHITLQGYCNILKNEYILSKSIYSIENSCEKLVFHENKNTILLKKIAEFLMDHTITNENFREISRSHIWRNYWGANKNNLFHKPGIDWTDEQKTLIVLSKMYDSVYEHPDCPPDEVINNDDMLEGWMIIQRRENEKIRSKNRMQNTLPGKLNNAQEVFLVAKSKEEAKAIYGLNDSQGMGIISERNKVLSTNNNIKEENLPDIKRDLIMKSNEQRKQMRK